MLRQRLLNRVVRRYVSAVIIAEETPRDILQIKGNGPFCSTAIGGTSCKTMSYGI